MAYVLANNQTSQELDSICVLKLLSRLNCYNFCVSRYF